MRWHTVPLWQTSSELRAGRHQTPLAEQSDARPSAGVSSPGSPVSPCTGNTLRVIPYVYSSTVRFPLTVNPCLPSDRASVRFCWQPSSLLLGRINPRVQSYVVLPQAWASPYQCLHVTSLRAGCGLRSGLLWKARFPAVTASCNNK